jgi:DNA polymerase III subunit alpha
MAEFVHLHNHTHYSLQDAACTVPTLVQAAKENDQPAVALTDHGVLYGAPEFYREANKAGVKPIIGSEIYMAFDGEDFTYRKPPDAGRTKLYRHLVLLVKNETGYRNLVKMVSRSFLDEGAFHYRPRVDWKMLEEHHEGLIALSACIGGVINPSLIQGNYDEAKRFTKRFKELFGDDFYLELQDHGLDKDKYVLEGVPKLAKELDVKMVATNDVHYAKREHAVAHNVLLLLSNKSPDKDYRKLRYGADRFYFRSTEEMVKLFGKYPGAIENTLEIAEKRQFEFDFSSKHFPVFPIPEESPAKTLDDYFELLAREGLEKRYDEITPEIQKRFDFEVGVIKEMGFPGYFLVTQDFIRAAREMGVPVGPGRGSAAGSIVAYALRITDIDPIEYDLLFERFLNPARNTMPDIDVDFADTERWKVIEYVKEKYGENSVCQIVTFNTLSSKAVIRDVGRVLGVPIPTVNEIVKPIPSAFGKVYSIDKALEEVPELRWLRETGDETLRELVKYARILEGMNRNASKHAAGVVIAPGEVSDYAPLAKQGKGDVVAQYSMNEIENAGLLKMDFLGLRTLSIIQDAVALVREHRGVEVDVERAPVDDEKTFRLFWEGRTTAIFQFESPQMREYLKRLRPQSIKDLTAMNALYRPGPMGFIDEFIERRFGRKQVAYAHPELEPILKETYGVIVYQEQVIRIANRFAGMSLADADILRRAMGKKKKEAMMEQKEKFLGGCEQRGIPKKTAHEIFAMIEEFAQYGFNKSHAAAYSYLAYQTAYLKAHYPAEFLASNLKHELHNQAKVAFILEDCRKLGIPVLPPDVANPSLYFNVEDGKIRFGMAAIKNVGVKAVEEIIAARKRLGRNFTSIFDFASSVDTRQVNKRALEGLALAGAFDSVEPNRRAIFESASDAIEYGAKMRELKELDAGGLFGGVEAEESEQEPEPPMPNVEDWDEREKLKREREATGFYMSAHPLRKYEIEARALSTADLADTENLKDDDTARVCGVVVDLETKLDRNENKMAFFEINTLTGSCKAVMFAGAFEIFGDAIEPEAPVFLTGKVRSTGDNVQLQIEEALKIDEARDRYVKYVRLDVPPERQTTETIEKLKALFERRRGKARPVLAVSDNGAGERLFRLDERWSVQITDEFYEEVAALLGDDAVSLIPTR